ncbi:D-2-hydroxyacid dehydrogenase [Motilimonas pumila]|uniref:D-2-hydroxyacid dehydrogenase n=1 Tax=Motilimonas pumila TaxID=2303987 RepID=A0A418YF30_9GAMM|nr:D-2-hydroxyacid dehydrogenase [Motilimonas pumila]RJG47882.1 D-2-hydroxyacid dehydrogenase [Motilimonas pumila]
MKTTLLVLSHSAPLYQELLQDRLPSGVNMICTDNIESIGALQQKITIALAEPSLIAPHLEHLSQLSWLQSTFAGVDALTQASTKHSYQLTGVKGIFGPLMVEYVFGHVLQLSRHIGQYRRQQQQQIWSAAPYQSLVGSTMLIAGTGDIGSALAKAAKSFGLNVIGMNRAGTARKHFKQCVAPQHLLDALTLADIVVNTLPSTAHNRHLFARQAFQKMKPSAIFINVGRGSTVHQSDLLQALIEKEIGHAVLDVFDVEPLPASDALWQQPNATITPHNAAVSIPAQVVDIFCDNLGRFLNHEALIYPIDLKKGY